MIHEQALMAVTEELSVGFGDSEEILKSPGQLKKHYAPKAKLAVLNWNDEMDLHSQLSTFNFQLSTVQIISHTKIPSSENFAGVSVIPHDAEAFARAIYAELHRCDDVGAKVIVVEAPPDLPQWAAIADRLHRAAS
jgi:L-threonylcarbamoyladenylate synthase